MLYRGMFWLQVALLLAYIGPVWPTMLVVLAQSCQCSRGRTDSSSPGTWWACLRAGPPGQYSGEEWQIMASLLEIQTAAVGGFMYFLAQVSEMGRWAAVSKLQG
jgi:hypothetical protein